MDFENHHRKIAEVAEKVAHVLNGEENLHVLFALLRLISISAEVQGKEDMSIEDRDKIYAIALTYLQAKRMAFQMGNSQNGTSVH
jgi:hypothetical protein